MKTLYNKDYRHTEDAGKLGDETHDALNSVFIRFIDMGYSPREIAHIMSSVVMELELDAVLGGMYHTE